MSHSQDPTLEDAALQGALDAARSLTGARYAALALLDDAGVYTRTLLSGQSGAETEWLSELHQEAEFLDYIGATAAPLRLPDLHQHLKAQGLPPLDPRLQESGPLPFLAAPLQQRGAALGNIFVAGAAPGRPFSAEHEQTLLTIAAQAAAVIVNARARRAERRAKDALQTLLDAAPVGVALFHTQTGAPLSLNRAARRMLDSLQLPGRSLQELLQQMRCRRPDGRESRLDAIAQALNAGETLSLEEVVLHVPDGRSLTALLNAAPLPAKEGEPAACVVTLQDITSLEDKERLRAEFMAIAGHELQMPLTAIQRSAAALLDQEIAPDPAETRQFHQIISEQAAGMRRLISDLLDVARIETGALAVFPEPCAAAALLDEAQTLFRSAGRANSIHLDVGPDLPRVMADRRRIVQVVGNLLSNAARHAKQRTAIRVSAAQDASEVVFTVADEGEGIAPERMPLLFRKFARLDDGEREAGRAGAGLGLAICKGIVERHGGRIWAESDGPGLGARFAFAIPVVEGEETGRVLAAAAAGSPQESAAGERKRILAVDDDPQALRYIRETLIRAGYEPVLTAEAENAVPLVVERKPHLVLLDMMFVETDGIEVMRRIREKRDLPVIFLSVYGQEGVIARAFDLGAADYVVKPYAPAELVARIRSVLRRQAGAARMAPVEDYVCDELRIDYSERRVLLAGRPVGLTATEYAVLAELSTNAGLVLTHDQILYRVWGDDNSGDSGLVRTIVKRLRQKLGDSARSPSYILTQPRVGYRMKKGDKLPAVRGEV